MKKGIATYVSCLVLGSALFSACSRPVAYFQRTPVAQYSTAQPVAPAEETVALTPVSAPAAAPVSAITTPAQPATQSAQAVEKLEAYVRNDSKLASNKRLGKRLDRIKSLLTESTTKQLSATTTEQKTSAMQRLLTKKLDKKISKHLAPNQPNKPMINGGLLTGSLILVLAGVLLLLLTTGTAATIGLIAAIVGAIGLIFGLLAS